MQKKYNGCKKLKIVEKRKRKEKEKRGKFHRTVKAQQNQRFITTIKSVTEYTHIHIHP